MFGNPHLSVIPYLDAGFKDMLLSRVLVRIQWWQLFVVLSFRRLLLYLLHCCSQPMAIPIVALAAVKTSAEQFQFLLEWFAAEGRQLFQIDGPLLREEGGPPIEHCNANERRVARGKGLI